MAVMKVIELMAESTESWEKATQNGLKKANESLKGVKSAFVQSQSVTCDDGEVKKYRVNLKVSFEVK